MKNRVKVMLIGAFVVLLLTALSLFAFASTGAESVLSSLKGVTPTVSDGHLVLPVVEGYKVEIFGSSNETIIAKDGTVYTPLVDTEVELMYKVTNESDANDVAVGLDGSCTVTVSGRYSTSDTDNPEPQTLPKLREWKGLTGSVRISEASRIIIENEEKCALAELIGQYITDITGFDLPTVVSDAASTGDIMLICSSSHELGDEGYEVQLESCIKILAPTDKGLLYGGTTLAQMLTLYDDYALPCGFIRDYPELEVRSLMLDVARAYIPLEYVEEITRYMAYYKLNRLGLHINDNNGEQDYCFRIESKLYPEINSGIPADEVYSQEDYRAFQKNALRYGVEVVTEMDTPAHAGFVNLYDPSLMLDKSHIDLSEENYDRSVAFVKSLLDEMLDGDDPVIVGKRFNVGMDEYSPDHTVLVKYMKDITDYLIEKGVKPEVWGALKADDFTDGAALASTDTAVHFWSVNEASLTDIIEYGYPVINNTGSYLYVCPGGFSKWFADRLDLIKLYEGWEANQIATTTVSMAHPQLKGVESALWNDVYMGMSKYDLFSRIRDQVALISEKGWYGARKDGDRGVDFVSRVEALRDVPGLNPMRRVETLDGIVSDTDFNDSESIELNGATVSGGVLNLDGKGYISLPYKAVGYPWTLSFSINYTSKTIENAALFDGEEGTLYLNYNGTGKLAYARESEIYLLDYVIPKDVWQDIILTCDGSVTRMYVNGIFVSEGKYATADTVNMRSSTFVLPTERIGVGVVGQLDNLTILNTAISHDYLTGADLVEYGNVALGKFVALSGIESGVVCTPSMAVDGIAGDISTRVAPNRVDDAWAIIDLRAVYAIDTIEIEWFTRPNKYRIYSSVDGKDWSMIHENLACQGKTSGTDVIDGFGQVKARYIKYQQVEMFVGNAEKNYRYSGAFTEIRAFGYNVGNEPFDFSNVALGKNVTVSGRESGVNCTPGMVVDGIAGDEPTRVALNRVDDAWCLIDLGAVYSIDSIEIAWYTRPNKYQIYVSEDKNEWIQVHEDLACSPKTSGLDFTSPLNGIKARYVKYQQVEMFVGNAEKNYRYSGAFTEIRVFGYEATDESYDYENVALGKDVIMSGIDPDTTCTPDMAVDGIAGDVSTRVCPERVDDAWVIVDLGSPYALDSIEMVWCYRPNKYQILVSADGENWTKVYEDLACVGKSSGTDKAEYLGNMVARYVKYQQLEMFVGNAEKNYRYSGNFTEIRVFGKAVKPHTIVVEAEELLSATERTEENAAFLDRLTASIELIKHIYVNGTREDYAQALRLLSYENEKLKNGDFIAEDCDTDGLVTLLYNKNMSEGYFESRYEAYKLAYSIALSVFIDSSTDNSQVAYALSELRAAKKELWTNITVDSNLNLDSGRDNFDYLFDGTFDKIILSPTAQKVGEYITFNFANSVDFSSIDVVGRWNANLLYKANVYISYNGIDFIPVTDVRGNNAVIGNVWGDNVLALTTTLSVKAIKIQVAANSSKGLAIYEVYFNNHDLDLTALDSELALDLSEACYTSDSYKAYLSARTSALAVRSAMSATQIEVDEALDVLVSAREALVPYIDFSGVNLNLNEDINVVFTLEKDASVTDLYMEFSFRGKTYTVTEYTVKDDGRYAFSFKKVMPYYMGEEIGATVYGVRDGVTVSATCSGMSVRKYCDTVVELNPTDTKLITLVSDLLTYGAKSQLYSGINVDHLVTDGADWLLPSSGIETENLMAVTGDNSGNAVWCGVGLNIANEMNMYFTFTATDVAELYVKISVNGREELYSVADMSKTDDGRYLLYFHGVMAFEFSDTVTASFVRSGVSEGAVLTYSVDSYTSYMQNSSNNMLADLTQAISNYGSSAKSYKQGG